MKNMLTNRVEPVSDRIKFVEEELNTLYQVSVVLSRSLQLHETLKEVLKLLNDCGRLTHGMVCLFDENSGEFELNINYADYPDKKVVVDLMDSINVGDIALDK